MTKAEIKELAKNIDLMDKMNTVSCLFEVNNATDNELIDSLINDIYKTINSTEKKTNVITKSQMMDYFYKNDINMYYKLKGKRFAEIRYEFYKLTKVD